MKNECPNPYSDEELEGFNRCESGLPVEFEEDEVDGFYRFLATIATDRERIEELEKNLNLLCPIGDMPVIESLKVEKLLMMERIAELEKTCQRHLDVGLTFRDKVLELTHKLDTAKGLLKDGLKLEGDAYYTHAPEDPEILELCQRIGFGAVMRSVARQWYMRDPIGCFTIGHCFGTITAYLSKAKGAHDDKD